MASIFAMQSEKFVLPEHIKNDYYKIIPKVHELGYKELIYDMLFYIDSKDKNYTFRVDTDTFKQYEIKWFDEQSCKLLLKYCDKIVTKKEEHYLVYEMSFTSYDSLNDKIKLLNFCFVIMFFPPFPPGVKSIAPSSIDHSECISSDK